MAVADNKNQEAAPVTEQPDQEAQQEEASGSVDLKWHKRVEADMMKFKAQARELQAKLDAQHKETLAQQQNWQKLYDLEKTEKENILKTYESEKSKRMNESKLNAVLSQLDSGFKKSEYNVFVNLDNIATKDDGSFDPKSVSAEVKRIKQEHPELLKASQVASTPNTAAKATTVKSDAPKTRSEMLKSVGTAVAAAKKSKSGFSTK